MRIIGILELRTIPEIHLGMLTVYRLNNHWHQSIIIEQNDVDSQFYKTSNGDTIHQLSFKEYIVKTDDTLYPVKKSQWLNALNAVPCNDSKVPDVEVHFELVEHDEFIYAKLLPKNKFNSEDINSIIMRAYNLGKRQAQDRDFSSPKDIFKKVLEF